MKSLSILVAGALLALLAACTPMIYGVPQERWDLMTEQERIAAMEAYTERQIAYQQAAAERARIRAEQEAARQARLEEEMAIRQERVDLIYHGRTGTFGDLLEVTLHGGQMRLSLKKRDYLPVTFKIADGEVKAVPIHYSKGRHATLYIRYENRHLWLDTDRFGQNTRRAAHLVYTDDWGSGITYTGISSHGAFDMRGVAVDIDVVPVRRAGRYGRQQPAIIIKERTVEVPPTIIVKEKIVQAPPQVIVKEKVVQAPPRVVVREKATERPAPVAREESLPPTPKEQRGNLGHRHLESVQQEHDGNGDDEIQHRTGRENAPSEEGEHDGKTLRKIHVELNGGKVLSGDKHHPFRPVNFWIAEGETRTVKLVLSSGLLKNMKKGNLPEQELTVTLQGGRLYFDGDAPVAVTGKKNARLETQKLSGVGLTISDIK